MARKKNVSSATVTGASIGAGGAAVITYASAVIEAKTGVPALVAAPILGTLFGFVARWAAKLNPND